MSNEASFEQETLSWVKQELDEVLDDARRSLERYIDNRTDESPLTELQVSLRQAGGTLQMVELYGAAMLSQEMEALAHGLIHNTIRGRDEALEVLLRALLRLPDYLGYIRAGNRDIPIVLLPLLNDLRTARNASLLTEQVLSFSDPDPEQDLSSDPHSAAAVDVRALARRLRHNYQLGLLDWFRDQDARGGLDKMKRVALELRDTARIPACRRLWWSTAALSEAVAVGALESGVTVKALLGKVDREIKRLSELGEDELARTIPEELAKNILYYTAYAEDRDGLIREVKQAYELDELLPQDPDLREARANLTGPSAGTLKTVARAVREDLGVVKDSLESLDSLKSLAARGDQDPARLEPVANKLQVIADTLSALGLNPLADKVKAQARTVASLMRGQTVSEAVLMDIAAITLDIETTLDNLALGIKASHEADGQPVQSADPSTESAVAAAEYRRLLAVVMTEAQRDLERAKEVIVNLVRDPKDRTAVTQVPALLERVRGAATLAQVEQAPVLLAAVSAYLRERVLVEGTTPAVEELDSLADAMTGIEYILVAGGKGIKPSPALLEMGRASVAKLGFSVDTQGGPSSTPSAHSAFNSEDTARKPDSAEATAWTPINAAFADLATAPAGIDGADLDTPKATEPPGNGRGVADSPAERAEPGASTEAARDDGVEPSSAPGTVDDELLQTIIEEAQAQLGAITQALSRWRESPDDPQPLTTMQRSFHTLNGSARTIGAQDLGEFAWAFEHLLNNVIDDTVMCSRTVRNLLAETPPALTDLMAQIKHHGAPKVDVGALIHTAHVLGEFDEPPGRFVRRRARPSARRKPPASSSAAEPGQDIADDTLSAPREAEPTDTPVRAETKKPEQAPADPVTRVMTKPSPGSPGAIDVEELSSSVNFSRAPASDAESRDLVEQDLQASSALSDSGLLDVFSGDAREQLEVIETSLAAAGEGSVVLPVTDDLLRALHTLAGSARAARVPGIARLCAPLEQLVGMRAAHQQPLRAGETALLREASTAVRDILGDLKRPDRPLPSHDSLLERIDAALRGESAADDHRVAKDLDEDIDEGAAKAPPVSDKRDRAAAPEISAQPSLGEKQDSSEVETASTGAAADFVPQDRELVEIFLEEARDLIDAGESALQKWLDRAAGGGANTSAVSDLRRHLHTLKGGARMAGCLPVGDLSHALESLIVALLDAREAPSPMMAVAMLRAFDRLSKMLQQADSAEAITPAPELIGQLDALRAGEAATAPQPAEAPAAKEPETEKASDASAPDAQEIELATASTRQARPLAEVLRAEAASGGKTGAPVGQIRVSSNMLNRLVNAAGEVTIYHARLERQMTGFGFSLAELEQTVSRLRDQLRKLEIETEAQILFRHEQESGELDRDFDPLELDRYSTMQQLSRALAESVSDLVSIREILVDEVRGSETLLQQQSRVSTDLQDDLMRTRMVRFSALAPRLRRISQQTARELGKEVELRVTGESRELDRSMLNRMIAPLEHMLRNAIFHGIELPDERRAAGKPEQGRVGVSIAREAHEIVIKVQDDGAGVNLAAVRRKACQLGMASDEDELSSQEILRFILKPGFSTASRVTQISGRGVGMDVVGAEVKQLGGMLSISSTPGKGTTFIVRLPLTLAINQALLVQSGDDLYAVPLTSIEGVVRLSARELRHQYAQPRPVHEYASDVYELRHLGTLLGRGGPVFGEPHLVYPVLLVKAGERRVALQAEDLLGNREVVVKPVGPQISKVKGISGATILGDGRVALILDLAGLVRTATSADLAYSADAPAVEPTGEKAYTVMVVDDSITIRKVTARMLERHRFAVLTAKDGVDALSQLRDQVPDLLLLDIEMPRMDGFELASYIRNTDHLRGMPIVMVTSRSGEKHRRRALEIGVDSYLGKPYQETELLENINMLLTARGAR